MTVHGREMNAIMTDVTKTPLFEEVREAVDDAILVAFDGCHKIYLAMDKHEADWFRAEYDFVVEDTPEEMLKTLGQWWEQSCGLRFISACRYVPDNVNSGFTHLISQFADYEEDEENENF